MVVELYEMAVTANEKKSKRGKWEKKVLTNCQNKSNNSGDT